MTTNPKVQDQKLVQTNGKDKIPQPIKNPEPEKKEKPKKPGLVDQMWQALVLPPSKLTYNISDLGPQIFIVANTQARREDFQIINNRGQKMECSYFEPFSVRDKPHPVVIYLHGNSSSRLEGLALLPYLLPIGIAVILMDFAGCGLSEGSYISLGYYEKGDAELVIDHIKKTKKISSVGIWGRSMGAATSLMLGTNRTDIEFIVADSSFVDIQILCREVAKKQYKLPNFLAKMAWGYIRKKIRQKVEFDINECNTIEYIKNAKHKPAIMFMSAKDDQLIDYSHSQRLFEAYDGSKNILLFEGNHNSRRPKYVQVEIQQFFKNNLTFHEDAISLQHQMLPNLKHENIMDELVCINPLHIQQQEKESYKKEIEWLKYNENTEQFNQNKFKNVEFNQPQMAQKPAQDDTISEPQILDDESEKSNNKNNTNTNTVNNNNVKKSKRYTIEVKNKPINKDDSMKVLQENSNNNNKVKLDNNAGNLNEDQQGNNVSEKQYTVENQKQVSSLTDIPQEKIIIEENKNLTQNNL